MEAMDFTFPGMDGFVKSSFFVTYLLGISLVKLIYLFNDFSIFNYRDSFIGGGSAWVNVRVEFLCFCGSCYVLL